MSTKLTRRGMYDLVWSKPMTKVAQDFGISDVALKKVCAKHRVPTPPRGFWARKEAGQSVKQTKFYEATDQQEELIVIHGSRNDLPPEVLQFLEQERERRKSCAATNPPVEAIAIEPVQDVHPVLAATAKTLRKAKPDKDDAVHAAGQGLCGVVVGSATRERAIYVLDRLIRLLEARGLKVEPADTCIRVVAAEPDALTFSLVERIDKRTHVATVDELKKEEQLRKKQERNSRLGLWFSRERAYPEFDFVRTSELGIQIKDQYVTGLRRSWNDGRHQRIEFIAENIASGMAAYLAGVKAKRERHEEWEREWQRRAQLYALAEARQKRETEREEFLRDLVETSTQADKLRSFLAQLHSRMPATPPAELSRLTDWAQMRLQSLEHELAPDAIAAALQEEKLFPEVDELAGPEPEED